MTIESVQGVIRGEWISKQGRSDNAGIIFYIHGGGYVSCSAGTHRPVTCWLARQTRLAVFSVNYELAPENPFPASVEGVLGAYRWLTETHPGIPIAIAGDSAGGGLVLTTIMRARDTGLPMPFCGVCFSPWTDMTGSGESVQRNRDRDEMFYPSTIDQFADVYLGDHDRTDPLASPVFGDFDACPPLLFHVSDSELLVDDSRRVHEKILETGGESTLEMFDGVFHGWQIGADYSGIGRLFKKSGVIHSNPRRTLKNGRRIRPGRLGALANGTMGNLTQFRVLKSFTR